MCEVIVVTRPGYELGGKIPPGAAQVVDVRGMTQPEISAVLARARADGPRTFFTDAAMIDISATAIRLSARAGESAHLTEMVPSAVANYIEKYELYKK